jgi:hypothetical protein
LRNFLNKNILAAHFVCARNPPEFRAAVITVDARPCYSFAAAIMRSERQKPQRKKTMRLSPAIIVLSFLLFCLSCSNTRQSSVSHNTNSPPSASTPSSQPTPTQYATSEATPASYLYQATIYLQGKPSAYDLSEARKRLELIPRTAPEYKEAQSLLAQIKIKENKPTSEAVLHVDYVDKIPVAVSQDAFYQIEDAISRNADATALIMIQKGRVAMIENNSPIVVLEPFGYLTRIKVKKGGRSGWVKSSWIQQE